jgi:hypothetical protein
MKVSLCASVVLGASLAGAGCSKYKSECHAMASR